MTTNIVFRDSDGKVINIGPWEYEEKTIVDDITGESSLVITNPLPDGATSKDEEVTQADDGSWSTVNP